MQLMLIHPQINPVALQIGPLAVHWYGLTYLAAFALFMVLGYRRLKHQPFARIKGVGAWSRRDVEDILSLYKIEITYDFSLRKYLIKGVVCLLA